tara:strand:- start:1171 stop:1563 length:393 start_codon:yes stop_codon:yes gene_type:complete
MEMLKSFKNNNIIYIMNPEVGTNFQDWKPVVLKKKTINIKNENVSNKKSNENDVIKINKTNIELKKAMQQARLSCKMSQKDVAQRMNVKTNLIVDYESGKLAPSNSFLSKLERIYNIKLPRATKVKIQND